MLGEFEQRFALFIICAFIDVNVLEVPISEGFKHAFAFGALHELGECEAVQGRFAVFAFRDENDLRAVTSHARWEGSEPATAWGVAGASLFEVAGNFPGNFGGGRFCGLAGANAERD